MISCIYVDSTVSKQVREMSKNYRVLRKPQTDIQFLFQISIKRGYTEFECPFSFFLNNRPTNIQPKSGTQPNWKHLAGSRF